MIRIVKGAENEKLSGKFVLFDGNNVFASFGMAREVIGETEGSIKCRTFARKMNESGKIIHSIADDDFEVSDHRKTSVRCICDTLSEVDHVVAVGRASRAFFDAAMADGQKLVDRLNGLELPDAGKTEALEAPTA